MSLIRRVAAIAVGAAAGCAAVALAYQFHKKHTEGPAEESAEAPVTVPLEDAPQSEPAAEAAEAEADAEQEPTYVPVARAVQQPDEPNVNPVADVVDDAPPVVDGKVDATKIASPEDFADWSEYGCQG